MESKITYLLGSAAFVMAATFLAHIFLGGADINAVVQTSDLPAEVRATSAVVWHMITALIGFFVVATLSLIRHANRGLAISVICLEAIFALIFIGVSIAAFSSPLALPQWTAFALASALTLGSMRRS